MPRKATLFLTLLSVALAAAGTVAQAQNRGAGGGAGGAGGGPTTKGNVTIQLPQGWALGNGGVLAAQAPQPDRDATGSFQASLLISQSPGNRVDPAAEQANVARKILGYQATEAPAAYTTKSGLKGVSFGGTYKNGLIALRSRQYMFIVNNQIYTVTFTCLASRWGAYQNTLEDCIASLVIK